MRPQAAAMPATTAVAARANDSRIICPRTCSGRGSDRHANADFAGTAGHQVGHHSVDAEGRQDYRHRGEDPDQQQLEALRRQGVRDALFHGLDIEYGLAAIHRVELALHRALDGERIAGGAHRQAHSGRESGPRSGRYRGTCAVPARRPTGCRVCCPPRLRWSTEWRRCVRVRCAGPRGPRPGKSCEQRPRSPRHRRDAFQRTRSGARCAAESPWCGRSRSWPWSCWPAAVAPWAAAHGPPLESRCFETTGHRSAGDPSKMPRHAPWAVDGHAPALARSSAPDSSAVVYSGPVRFTRRVSRLAAGKPSSVRDRLRKLLASRPAAMSKTSDTPSSSHDQGAAKTRRSAAAAVACSARISGRPEF